MSWVLSSCLFCLICRSATAQSIEEDNSQTTQVHDITWNTKCTIHLCNLCCDRLDDAQKELDDTRNKSATTLLATEDEILQLKAEWVSLWNTAIIDLFSDLINMYILYIYIHFCADGRYVRASVCTPHMSSWTFIRGKRMLLMTTNARFDCWEMKFPSWVQRRPCCRRGAPLLTHTNTTIQNNVSYNSCILCDLLSGWWEAALQAPCPGTAALPAPLGVSPPPEPNSLTPPAMHALCLASMTCMLWSVWRPRVCFDVTFLT